MKKKQEKSAAELALRTSGIQQDAMMDDNEKTRVFAIKFTFCQSIFIAIVGRIITLIGFLIKIAKLCGLDLSTFFFPLPFFNFWKATLQVQNYRINGAKVRLNAGQADAYFLFLKEGLLNFYTLGTLFVWLQVYYQHSCLRGRERQGWITSDRIGLA